MAKAIARRPIQKSGYIGISDLKIRSIRTDCTVGTAERWLADLIGVPRGIVQFVRPDRRKARTDKTIGSVLADWEAK